MGQKNEKCPAELREALTGPCPSVRTPFDRGGQIDWPGLRRQIDYVISAGAKNLVLTYGNSLFSLLTDDEIAEITKVVIEQVDKRALVVAATGNWWTGKSVEFAEYCTKLGADMLMVLPPDWAGSTTVNTLVDHYSAIGKHLPVMIVTNYLKNRPLNFSYKVIETLVERAPGVVALKDDVCGEFVRKACLIAHDHWAIIAGGLKQNHMNMLPYGVDGYFSNFIMFKPEITWSYWNAILEGDLNSASAIIRDYDMPFFDYNNSVVGGRDAAIHGILECAGHSKRYRRAPYYTLSDKEQEELNAHIVELFGRWD